MARRLFSEHLLCSSVMKTSQPFFHVFTCKLCVWSKILGPLRFFIFLINSNCRASMVEIVPVILVLLRVTSLLLSQGFSWILMFFGIGSSSVVSLEAHFSGFTEQNTVSLTEPFLSLPLPFFDNLTRAAFYKRTYDKIINIFNFIE